MTTVTMIYLDPSRVTGVRQSDAPLFRGRTGYGNKIPTTWEIRMADKRWRRVYAICWSNSATPYVLVRGEPHYLGGFDPGYWKAP